MLLSVRDVKGYQYKVSENATVIPQECEDCIILKTENILKKSGIYW